MRRWNWGLILAVLWCFFAWGMAFTACARAAAIPDNALRHRALLIRVAQYAHGLDAPIATYAAQIHQESAWNERAISRAGAQGLAQFMPRTAAWVRDIVPGLSAIPAPYHPAWAMEAMIGYDRWLLSRTRGATPCDAWAFALRGYNGGEAWLRRDQRLAAQSGLNPQVAEHVAMVNAGRSPANFRENVEYPRRILYVVTPIYASWGPGVPCGGQ